jgi:DNA invertase Pin-like site-specific DNA recombinase
VLGAETHWSQRARTKVYDGIQMASLAQCERALIRERVNAGMARAIAQGKRIARVPLAVELHAPSAMLSAAGLSIHQISKQLGIG